MQDGRSVADRAEAVKPDGREGQLVREGTQQIVDESEAAELLPSSLTQTGSTRREK